MFEASGTVPVLYVPLLVPDPALLQISRRKLLSIGTVSLAARCCPAFATVSHRPNVVVESTLLFLRNYCPGYLRFRAPYCFHALWRGGDTLGIQAPPSDLLDENVVGTAGRKYFEILERESRQVGVRPSRAHIATGDKSIAAAWGRPRSVWPIGDGFRFMYWSNSTLIFPSDLGASSTLPTFPEILERYGPAVLNDNLESALVDGREIMFEMGDAGFLVVDESLTYMILERLAQQDHLP